MLVRVTGKIEETSRSVVSNATLVIDLEAHEAPRHCMLVWMAIQVMAVPDPRTRMI
jgi:hypothetical protein